eukprot:GHVL01012222.1.p1 GENE.GHVL01012222.1~~GHVL01012222.1.p1  ORF type:complete len:641 (+),score=120.41 GHVL01012222.1:40-1923(+)
MGILNISILEGKNFEKKDTFGKSDPYVDVYFGNKKVYKTKCIKKSLNPKWNENFSIPIDGQMDQFLTFSVMDKNLVSQDEPMGGLKLGIHNLAGGKSVEQWYPLSSGIGEIYIKMNIVSSDNRHAPQSGFRPMTNYANPQGSQGPPSSGGGGEDIVIEVDRSVINEMLRQVPHRNEAEVVEALAKTEGNKEASLALLRRPGRIGSSNRPPGPQQSANLADVEHIQKIMPNRPVNDIVAALNRNNHNKEAAINDLLNNPQPIHIQQGNNSVWVFPREASNQPFEQDWSNFQPYMHANAPQVGIAAAPVVNQPPPRPSGRKKAVLIGINYPGTQAALRGCHNDVTRMKQILSSLYGYPTSTDHMVCLLDDPRSSQIYQPTRKNITSAMQWLVAGAQPGDMLFFHYSGHGAQQRDLTGRESDGFDETILPCDFKTTGQMTDDELYNTLVRPLPSGTRLTCIMDCCHSGTGLDLPFTYDQRLNNWVVDENPNFSLGDVQLFSGCEDYQTSADAGSAYSSFGGAMTTAFCNALEDNPYNHSYPSLLNELHRRLKQKGFRQRPQLTSLQSFDINRPFSLTDGIIPNHNAQMGRFTNKKKKPQRDLGNVGKLVGVGMAAVVGGKILGELLDAIF